MSERMPEPRGGSAPRRDAALWRLTHARVMLFVREPEAMFWVFAFPVLMALALGIAFRSSGPQPSRVGVLEAPGALDVVRALQASPDLEVVRLTGEEADRALVRGSILVLVRPRGRVPPQLVYDPARPETRLAHLAAIDALERAAGREDRLHPTSDTRERPGARYIDFLIPGLIGLNLLGTGMWGVGFAIATARQQKLLKRMIATPMRKSDYLLSFLLARLVWLVLEVVAILGFGWLAFGVALRGSWVGLVAVVLVGALAFSAMGLLVASRARTIEGVSGLMNLVMLPMWLLSGTFFSADRFPAAMQPVIQALPLTAANDALRALINEGAGLGAIAGDLGSLLAWATASFVLALRVFRWE
jgi:ABC-type multidrug transport system permease subunit